MGPELAPGRRMHRPARWSPRSELRSQPRDDRKDQSVKIRDLTQMAEAAALFDRPQQLRRSTVEAAIQGCQEEQVCLSRGFCGESMLIRPQGLNQAPAAEQWHQHRQRHSESPSCRSGNPLDARPAAASRAERSANCGENRTPVAQAAATSSSCRAG